MHKNFRLIILMLSIPLCSISCLAKNKVEKPPYVGAEDVTPPLFNKDLKITWWGLNVANGFDTRLQNASFVTNKDTATLNKGYDITALNKKNMLSVPYKEILLSTKTIPKDPKDESSFDAQYIQLIHIVLKKNKSITNDGEYASSILGEDFLSYKCNSETGNIDLFAQVTPRGEVMLLKKYISLNEYTVDILPPSDDYWRAEVFHKNDEKKKTISAIQTLYGPQDCKLK